MRIREGHPQFAACSASGALVSRAALAEGASASWMRRDPPAAAEDSGWVLLEGSENESFLEDAANLKVCTVSWLIERDPTLASAFRGEHGDFCTRDTLAAAWQQG